MAGRQYARFFLRNRQINSHAIARKQQRSQLRLKLWACAQIMLLVKNHNGRIAVLAADLDRVHKRP